MKKETEIKWKWLLRSNSESFLTKRKDWEEGDIYIYIYRRMLFRNCVSQVHVQRRVLRIERSFMAGFLWAFPEYGSMSRKDAITSFSKNSAIVDPNFESKNLILLTRDWITCDLWGQGRKGEVLKFNCKKREQFLQTFRIYRVK